MHKHPFLIWLAFAAVITIIFGTIYGAVQQSIRQAANDPQIELAEDTAVILAKGADPKTLLGPAPTIDFGTSLSPFAIAFDETGKPIASTGSLGELVPVPPSGVFAYARSHADDRLTWQPASSTRVATVVKHFTGATPGFILVGRNIREIEDREKKISLMTGIGWIVSLVIMSGAMWLARRKE